MVDSLTWTVLVPMLRSNPDPDKVKWAERMFFNFYSYNTVRSRSHPRYASERISGILMLHDIVCVRQHGANLGFITGELLLNRMPFIPYLMGALGLYVSAFGLWSFTYFRLNGLWLYPVSCCSTLSAAHAGMTFPKEAPLTLPSHSGILLQLLE
jgi:hypothetical protein